MSDLKVERGVPIPGKIKADSKAEFFKSLQAGDSFECDYKTYNWAKQWFFRHRKDLLVVTRVTEGVRRVWIVSKDS